MAEPASSPSRFRRPRAAAALVCALCLLLSALPFPAQGTEGRRGPEVLSLGYMASTFIGMDTEEARNTLRTWVERFYRKHVPGGSPRIHVFRDVAGMERALREKRVDVVCTASDDFVRLRNAFPLRPILVSARREGGAYQRMVVLVRRDRGFRRLGDLQGKRIVVAEDKRHSISRMWLETLLMRETRRAPDGFFSSIREAPKPTQGVLAVFFGQADACVTYRRLFDAACAQNPQICSELVELARSEELATGVVSVRPDLDPKEIEWISGVIEGMHRNPAGTQVLRIHRVDHFLPYREEYLATAGALVEEHDRLHAALGGRH